MNSHTAQILDTVEHIRWLEFLNKTYSQTTSSYHRLLLEAQATLDVLLRRAGLLD